MNLGHSSYCYASTPLARRTASSYVPPTGTTRIGIDPNNDDELCCCCATNVGIVAVLSWCKGAFSVIAAVGFLWSGLCVLCNPINGMASHWKANFTANTMLSSIYRRHDRSSARNEFGLCPRRWIDLLPPFSNASCLDLPAPSFGTKFWSGQFWREETVASIIY